MHYCMNETPSNAPDNLDWTLLRSFIAVMRLGSLSAAAQAIGQTQPTVGRHIRALEEVTREALFTRQGNRLTPTDRALALYERAAPMEEAAYAVSRAVAGGTDDIEGTVRLSVPEVFGVHVIPEILASLSEDWPRLAVELSATNRTDDLSRREADIAVRLFRISSWRKPGGFSSAFMQRPATSPGTEGRSRPVIFPGTG
jgi:DNA-binding transcriptional LysR family regulator